MRTAEEIAELMDKIGFEQVYDNNYDDYKNLGFKHYTNSQCYIKELHETAFKVIYGFAIPDEVINRLADTKAELRAKGKFIGDKQRVISPDVKLEPLDIY